MAVLEDPEACRLVLEIILGRKISKVNVRTEHSIFLNSDARCIRLDVHATVNEDSIRALHEKVTTLKKSREWEAGYMKFEELMNRQKSEGFAEGELKGKLEAICLLLSELGELPDEVRAKLEAEADPEKLAIWLKLAAKAESINAFVEQM